MERLVRMRRANSAEVEIVLTFELERIYQDYIEGRKTREEFLKALKERNDRAHSRSELAETLELQPA